MNPFGPNTHGEFVHLPGIGNAFIDGVQDKCAHEWDGPGYHFVTYIGGCEADPIPNTGQSQDEMIALDEQLRKEGKYLSGGCVSCSKCGKPYEPEMF